MEHRTPPVAMAGKQGLVFDAQCESAVLAAVLTNDHALDGVRDILTEDCFFIPANIAIWQGVRDAEARGLPPDFINVRAVMAKAGESYDDALISLMSGYHATDVTDYAYRLKELAIRRRLWQLGTFLTKMGESEETDVDNGITKATEELQAIVGSAEAGVTTLADVAKRVIEQMRRNAAGDRGIFGTPTGFEEIDRRGGLAPGDLVVVAAETSQGKTSFATAMAMSAIKTGHPVAFYSMEMTDEQLTARVGAMESGVNSRRILQDPLDMATMEAVERTMEAIPGNLCYLDDNATSSIDKILSSIRTLHKKHGIKGAVVDYLQILNVNMKTTNKEQAMGDVARRLKNIAKELGVWIVAVSQLNREGGSALPSLSRLRDSGQIGEAADTIVLLYRPPEGRAYPGELKEYSTTDTAMVDVAKGRNIGTFRFICGFNARTTKFFNIPQAMLKKRGDPDDPAWTRKEQTGNLDELPF